MVSFAYTQAIIAHDVRLLNIPCGSDTAILSRSIRPLDCWPGSGVNHGDDGESNFELWRETIVGVEAKILTRGPGPHLVNKQWNRPPPDKLEAHFVVLDLFTQGGILAALSFVWLTTTACLVAYRARLFALTTLIFVLFVFSMFHHFIIRHPIFWFSIALCLALGDGAAG